MVAAKFALDSAKFVAAQLLPSPCTVAVSFYGGLELIQLRSARRETQQLRPSLAFSAGFVDQGSSCICVQPIFSAFSGLCLGLGHLH